jgi:hypothetical protein
MADTKPAQWDRTHVALKVGDIEARRSREKSDRRWPQIQTPLARRHRTGNCTWDLTAVTCPTMRYRPPSMPRAVPHLEGSAATALRLVWDWGTA